jgi:hypothetical protein
MSILRIRAIATPGVASCKARDRRVDNAAH